MKKTNNIKQLDRRSFLQVTALAGGGMMIGLYAPAALAQRGGRGGAAPAPLVASNFITINPDNTFTIIAKNPETGQGIRNALPQLIADELDVDWNQVKVQQADRDNAKYGNQIEGGSTAIPSNYTPMRQIGATGRAMILAAAADNWGVAVGELTTASGVVRHAASNRTATYGSLAAKAATMPVPANVALKDPKDFKIIGKPLPGIDNRAIVTGAPSFSVDVNPPGALHAVFEKCPVFRGRAVSANLDEIKKLPGVRHAFIVEPPPPSAAPARGGGGGGGGANWDSGVAIVADSWWLAQNARKSLRVTWDEGPTAAQSTTGYTARAKELSAQAGQAPAGGGQGAAVVGDVDAAFQGAAKTVEVIRYAVMDRVGEIEFSVSELHHAQSQVAERIPLANGVGFSRTIRVPAVTLDAFVFERNQPAPDAVKIDIEGAEHLAAKGMQRILREYRPGLFVELHNLVSAKTTFEIVGEFNYSIKALNGEPFAVEMLDDLTWAAQSNYLVAYPR